MKKKCVIANYFKAQKRVTK